MTTLLAIDWTTTGIKTLQFILSFSIIVTLHELGHFISARIFKCRVEKFYLFFNPLNKKKQTYFEHQLYKIVQLYQWNSLLHIHIFHYAND